MIRQLLFCGALLLTVGCQSTYLLSQVDSGTSGEETRLTKRYRIIAAEVIRSDDHGWFWDSKMRIIVRSCAIEGCAFPEFSEMYGGVFSNDATAVPIKVIVQATGRNGDNDITSCTLDVTDARTGAALGSDGFSLEIRKLSNDELMFMSVPQSVHAIKVEDVYRKTVLEGFAGAVVAALEKAENNGVRAMRNATPPHLKNVVSPMEKTF